MASEISKNFVAEQTLWERYAGEFPVWLLGEVASRGGGELLGQHRKSARREQGGGE